MNKPIKIIFTLSLLLNLILVGVAGGCWWKRMDHHRPFANTTDATQAVFKQAFEQNRSAMRDNMAAIGASREALKAIMTAQEFDRAAYDVEVKKVLDVRNGMGRHRAEILGNVLAELPQAEREKVAQKILSKLTDDRPHGRGQYGDHGKKPRGPHEAESPRSE